MVKLVSEKPQGGVNYILDTWSSIIPSIEDNHLYLSTTDAKSILFNREIFCFLSPFLSSLIKGTFQGSCCLANYFDTTIILPDVSSKAVYDLKSLMIKGTVSGLSGYDAKELKSLYSFLGFESRIMKEENDDEITVVHEYRIEDDKTDGDGGYDDYDEGDEANNDDRFLKIGSRGENVNDGTVQMICGDVPIRSSSEEDDDDVNMIDRENITNSHDEFEENEDLSSTNNNQKTALDLNAKKDERVEKMADEDVYIPSSSTEKDNDADMSDLPSNSMLPSPDGMTHSPGVPHGTGPHGPTSNSLAPSSSSGVNTPIGPPASQEDREYLDKVNQMETYIEPLRRLIMKMDNEGQDKLAKMKKLLDILSNPDKRMPLGTLLKCEDFLKRMLNKYRSTENNDAPSNQMLPSPGGMTPSTVPHCPGVPHGPTSNSMVPSPSSGVKTPIGPPASQEDREYLDKVKQMEKYIEPLRRKIMEIGNKDQDKLAKIKKLLDILSNPDKRMPLATLLKCEDLLKRLNTVKPEENEDKSTENRKTTPDNIGQAEEPTRASNKVMENASVMDEDLNEGVDWWRLRLGKIPGTSNNISSTDPDNEEDLDNEGESNKIKTRLRKKKDSIYKKKRDSDDSDFDVENVRPAQKRKRSGRSQGPVSYEDMFSSDDF